MNTHRIEQNGFRLVEVVDDTSRTIVWKAVQNTLDRTVIIRVLKPDAAANPTEVEHFLSIARLVSRIKCEAIAAVFDIVSENDLHYVVMEHVEGPTLEELVSSHGPLSTDQTLRIAASLVSSLSQLWQSAHIVHRNLKSSTIRLDPRGVAKITDFSLAIKAGPDVDATALDGGHIVGTPCYLSPEQAQGSHMLNTQSDMYGLGVVLYHLATGTVPFEDRAVVAILAGHIKHLIPPPHVLNKHIPVSFSWLLHRLMMKNPNNRYDTWEHVLQDIHLILKGSEPSSVRPDEEYLSTIDIHYAKDSDKEGPPGQSPQKIRLNRKEKNAHLASYQGSELHKDHASGIRRDELKRSFLCWGLLTCWLMLVFWFRAIHQSPVVSTDTPNIPEKTSVEPAQPAEPAEERRSPTQKDEPANVPAATPEPTPPKQPAPVVPAPVAVPVPAPAAAAAAPAVAPKPEPDQPPAGIPPALIQKIAQAIANADLGTARQAVKGATELFQERGPLLALLEKTPDPDALVAEYLKTQIGKPLLFEHNGKQRTVVPRSIENGVIQLEANGRGAEIPIDKLTADEKLRWMDKPQDSATEVAYCMTLLRSARRDEIHTRVTACPLLSEAFIQALRLVPAATPPAE